MCNIRGICNFQTFRIPSFKDFQDHQAVMQEEYKKRGDYETRLITGGETHFTVDGFCHVCQTNARLAVDYSYSHLLNGIRMPNWREHLKCPLCGLNNRMRASVHMIEHLLSPSKNCKIYISEQTTPLYRRLSTLYPALAGSEFLGNKCARGGKLHGIRNESLTSLSFHDGEFEFVLSFDCFEHIPDYKKAFSECARILQPEGAMLFTVPFVSGSEKNIVRARLNDAGETEHLLPPEYHGDPVNPEGCLAYYHFGWEMLNDLKEAGFSHSEAVLYWSAKYGYLGGEQIMFIAKKAG